MNKLLVRFQYESNVTVEVYPDEQPDWSWADEEVQKDANRGKIEQVYILVKATDESGYVTGTDSLGGVVVGYDDHKQEIRDAIEDNDMVDIAKADLAEKLKTIRGAK